MGLTGNAFETDVGAVASLVVLNPEAVPQAWGLRLAFSRNEPRSAPLRQGASALT